LASAEMRKAPKPATVKPLDFATAIRAPKGYLRTRVYQDGVGEQVVELFSEFFALWTKSIAFPELALPVIILLKRWLKETSSKVQGKGNKNQKLNTSLQLLVQKLESNSKFVEDKRRNVEFAPNDRRGVEAFLKEMEWSKTPLGAYVAGQRRAREEKAKDVEEGRREEERKREGEKGGRSREQELMDGSEDEEDEDEMMMNGEDENGDESD
jgi:nucleolar complex protein 2